MQQQFKIVSTAEAAQLTAYLEEKLYAHNATGTGRTDGVLFAFEAWDPEVRMADAVNLDDRFKSGNK